MWNRIKMGAICEIKWGTEVPRVPRQNKACDLENPDCLRRYGIYDVAAVISISPKISASNRDLFSFSSFSR